MYILKAIDNGKIPCTVFLVRTLGSLVSSIRWANGILAEVKSFGLVYWLSGIAS
jgi:hypothetical protein